MPRTISTTFRDVRPSTEPENKSGLLLPFTRITHYLFAADRSTIGVSVELYISLEISITAEVAHGIIIVIFVPHEQTGQINTRTPSIIPLTSPMLFWPLYVWNPERKVRKCKFHIQLFNLAHSAMMEKNTLIGTNTIKTLRLRVQYTICFIN